MMSATRIFQCYEYDRLKMSLDGRVDPFNSKPSTILDGNVYTYEITYYAEEFEELCEVLNAVRVALNQPKGILKWIFSC